MVGPDRQLGKTMLTQKPNSLLRRIDPSVEHKRDVVTCQWRSGMKNGGLVYDSYASLRVSDKFRK